MTDKEFKRLNRYQLIDIIYRLQLKQKELEEENQKLNTELADRRIRLDQAGDIAEASLAIHGVMEAAQAAASRYLEEIRMMRVETEEKCQQLLTQAQKDAEKIAAQAMETLPPARAKPKASGKRKHKKKKRTGGRR